MRSVLRKCWIAGNRYCNRLLSTMARLLLLIMAAMIILDPIGKAAALKFVVGPVIGGSSVSVDIMGVAAQLQERGHSVTVLVPQAALSFVKVAAARHSSNSTAEAMRYVTVELGFATEAGAAAQQTAARAKRHQQHKPHQQQSSSAVTLSSYAGPPGIWRSVSTAVNIIAALHGAMAIPCGRVVQDQQVMTMLQELQPDAVLGIGLPVGDIAPENCMCMLADALGPGVAAVDVFCGFYGAPASVPQFGALLTPADLRTPAGLAKNLAVWAALKALPLALDLNPRNQWAVVRKQAGLPPASANLCPIRNSLSWLLGRKSEKGCRKCESVVKVVLASWLVEHPRELEPHQVLVGPGTPRQARPLTSPPAVATFLDTAPAGCVLVAFGSTGAYAGMMEPSDFIELAQGFAALDPVRVLWHIQPTGLPGGVKLHELPLGPNTLIESGWIDYNDILGHSNTRAFVSHGGLHSVYEAAYHGVPVVGVPFIYEQADHVLKLVARGAAVLSWEAPAFRRQQQQQESRGKAAAAGSGSLHFTKENVAQLIQQILQDTSYADAAGGISQALQLYAKHRHPYERAADAIELAVSSWHLQHASKQQQQQLR